MIQTHLLKAEPPYQIISAAGQVGIQVATLIVTEDKSTEEGYQIDTHSHPVVNYGLKTLAKNQNKVKILAYYELLSCLRAEGAVWNKVEISDVQVIGLAGITNEIGLLEFCSLVPPSNIGLGMSIEPVWNKQSVEGLEELRWSMQRVGIGPARISEEDFIKDDNNCIIVNLKSRVVANLPPLLEVDIPSHNNFPGLTVRFPLFEDGNTKDTSQCEINVSNVITTLLSYFVIGPGIVFKNVSAHNKYYEYVQQITKSANESALLFM